VNDELLMSGTAGVHQGPLIIHDTPRDGEGDLILDSASADIGSPGNPVPLFKDGDVTKKDNQQNYHADPVYDWAPELEFPELTYDDLAYYYYSETVPSPYSQTSTSPWQLTEEAPMAVWDVNSTIDGSTALTFSEQAAQAAQPQADDSTNMTRVADPYRVDWSYSTSGNTTTLTIKFDNNSDGVHHEVRPILFVDGNLTITASRKFHVRYEGKGTIIANGKISVNGDFVPTGSNMGSDPPDLIGFPDTNRLGLITRGNIFYDGKKDEWLAAALYGGDTVYFSNEKGSEGGQGGGPGANFIGSTVAGTLDLGEQVPHLYTQAGFSNKLPPRMPGGDARITSIIGWTEMTPP